MLDMPKSIGSQGVCLFGVFARGVLIIQLWSEVMKKLHQTGARFWLSKRAYLNGLHCSRESWFANVAKKSKSVAVVGSSIVTYITPRLFLAGSTRLLQINKPMHTQIGWWKSAEINHSVDVSKARNRRHQQFYRNSTPKKKKHLYFWGVILR